MGYAYEGPQACGCEWTRCERHAAMMKVIRDAVWAAPASTPDAQDRFHRVWAKSDGYGEPGEVPVQGYDWSGIRDSSIEAVEAMYAEAIR